MRPPLTPKVDSVLVLDGDGNRLAGKYYGDFLAVAKDETGSSTAEARAVASELRQSFERQLQSKMHGMVSRSDAAEVVMVSGKTAVFCGGSSAMPSGGPAAPSSGDVRVVIVGSQGESELVLAYFAEGMYDALASLMGGSTERSVVLDNLELVLLLIDELCDGGIILETDSHKLVSSVLLREDDGFPREQQPGMPRPGQNTMGASGMAAGELTIGQALRQAREQLISQLGNQGGM